MSQPQVKVGIMQGQASVKFFFPEAYIADGKVAIGPQQAEKKDGKIFWRGGLYEELEFFPQHEANGYFELCDVTIGIGFHWERKENQRFRGVLRLALLKGELAVINVVPIEDYLSSVISSEMSATASLELLKAHAVISRSWLLAQIEKRECLSDSGQTYCSCSMTDTELLRWYDREDHEGFDVCADDHCQRYQGITRKTTAKVQEAVDATKGEVLVYEGKLCDARFSKSCGGVFEEFENCWEPVHHPYLSARRDNPDSANFPDLSVEANARKWILDVPDAFCNTHDPRILSQVLNNYDQETTDFYRWRVEYTQSELRALVEQRSALNFGGIVDLVPMARGTSGRIYRLKIIGLKKTLIIGKELEIRKILSPTHLYSSAFVVEKHGMADGLPEKFILHGAGWGHGVGLCQIGAAVMGEMGYGYKEILSHYFIGASIQKQY